MIKLYMYTIEVPFKYLLTNYATFEYVNRTIVMLHNCTYSIACDCMKLILPRTLYDMHVYSVYTCMYMYAAPQKAMNGAPPHVWLSKIVQLRLSGLECNSYRCLSHHKRA